MRVTREGSVRVDLVGGTLDLEPINLILPNVVTLNAATTLKAKVAVEKDEFEGVVIHSKDYDKTYHFKKTDFNLENLYSSDFFQEMAFVCQILDLFQLHSGARLELSSGAPAGSGLGGSSAMGVTLYAALCEFLDRPFDVNQAVTKVRATEGRILNQGIPGYQDYFPALAGGVLCIKGVAGELVYEQLFTPELKEFLESRVTLVYSGVSRASGINNWEVYKAFFDKNAKIRSAMSEIAAISHQAYLAVKNQDYQALLELVGKEGDARKLLAPNIVPMELQKAHKKLLGQFEGLGMKMCGAGGGGCFLLTHRPEDQNSLWKAVRELGMEKLDFCIDHPVQYS